MSSQSPFGPFKILLPDDREVEVVMIRLESGKLVARTPEELELLERRGTSQRPPQQAAPSK